LEKAYQSKGYQTVTVSIPEQNAQNGIVVLKVAEAKVGRLRVKGSRYSDLDKIKEKAPSVAEGKLPNLNEVTKDIVALNQLADRKVTPALRAGIAPGTVDVDLNVEDKLPLHASVELNNRQSPNTKPLRRGHYDNVWQRRDSVSFSYQVAPEHPEDATVYPVPISPGPISIGSTFYSTLSTRRAMFQASAARILSAPAAFSARAAYSRCRCWRISFTPSRSASTPSISSRP
jgi:hemolysin activation/secretion protein